MRTRNRLTHGIHKGGLLKKNTAPLDVSGARGAALGALITRLYKYAYYTRTRTGSTICECVLHASTYRSRAWETVICVRAGLCMPIHVSICILGWIAAYVYWPAVHVLYT